MANSTERIGVYHCGEIAVDPDETVKKSHLTLDTLEDRVCLE